MKPVQFKYVSCVEVRHATTSLQQLANAKYIGGGQSLGPMLNLRLARPETLVGVTTIQALQQIKEDKKGISYGAATCHAKFEDGLVPDASNGMLRHVAGGIAYRAVRNRGTLGGSLAHADPAADWVNVMVALDAQIQVVGPEGERSIPSAEFMQAAFMTALQPGEMIQSVWVPRLSANARWGYYKCCRKVGEFSEATGTVVIDPERGYARIVLGALDGPPELQETLADILSSRGTESAMDSVEEAIAPSLEGMTSYRRQLCITAIRRALQQLRGK
ncbi:FAD binding domain-containing protein [Oceanisphaera sediminis]|uniref:FAD binding domain-containing protein n=1 Tax=Oceanisphaera sediminis TaxID=981381 RepID=A0ABP7DQM1_9GAMM